MIKMNFKKILLLCLLAVQLEAKDLKIAAQNKLIASIVTTITGELAYIGTVFSKGTHGHHLSLSPSNIKILKDADIFICNSLELVSIPDDVKNVLDLAKIDGLKLLPVRSRTCCDHHHEKLDSHFMFDLENVEKIAKAIFDYVAQNDPEHKCDYEKNYTCFIADIAEMKKIACKALKPGTSYISEHDTTQYIDHVYGTKLVASLGMTESSSLSSKAILDIKKLILTERVQHIVVEFNAGMSNYNDIFNIKTYEIVQGPEQKLQTFWRDYFLSLVRGIGNIKVAA
jgi:ABC-type Zn uptake system ZnuABC Zn-binding protein ZnuA